MWSVLDWHLTDSCLVGQTEIHGHQFWNRSTRRVRASWPWVRSMATAALRDKAPESVWLLWHFLQYCEYVRSHPLFDFSLSYFAPPPMDFRPNWLYGTSQYCEYVRSHPFFVLFRSIFHPPPLDFGLNWLYGRSGIEGSHRFLELLFSGKAIKKMFLITCASKRYAWYL